MMPIGKTNKTKIT